MTFIIIEDAMTDFNPIEDIEMLTSLQNVCVVRTPKLIETLRFMQNCWWKIYELQPDDEWEIEYNILTFYKPKNE